MIAYHRENYNRRPTVTEFARRGCVVISIDTFMVGERPAVMDADRASG